MEELMKTLQNIGESLKKLSQDAETRARATLGLTEIMEGRAREISRTWEAQVSEACAQITSAAGSAQYLQESAKDMVTLLSRMISDLQRMETQSRAQHRSRVLWTSILTACMTSVISPLIWHLCARLL